MGSEAFEIRTSDTLLAALKLASSRPTTGAQLLEQRASYVYGSMKPNSSISKERIKEVLAQQQGGQGTSR